MYCLSDRAKSLTHEASGIGSVGAHFSIDFNETLVDDCDDFASGQSVLEPVPEEDGKGEGFAQFVGTRGRARGLAIYV